MRFDPSHPEQCLLPSHTDLGPDPEPCAGRFGVLLGASNGTAEVTRSTLQARPAVCPLAAALGGEPTCTGRSCVYFEMPGVPLECAIEQWAPDVVDDPDLASWYRDRAVAARVLAKRGDLVAT